jgi:DnaJ-class molecular chaperone
MATPMQTLPATADVPTVRPCFWCNGSGLIPNDDEQRYDACRVCEGTGSRPAPQFAEPIAA